MKNAEKNKKKSNRLLRCYLNLHSVWKVLLIMFTLIGALIVLYYSVTTVSDLYRRIVWGEKMVYTYMTDDYEVRTYSRGTKCIAKDGSIRIAVKDIDWVRCGGEDSLWVVGKNGRATYFNTRSGKLATPFIYLDAWCFSEDVAVVVDTNLMICFIDRNGNRAIDKSFTSDGIKRGAMEFHHGHCQIFDSTGMAGIIDRNGNWTIEPTYDSAAYICGYWWLTLGDSLTVLDSACNTIIDMTRGEELRINEDGTLFVWHSLYPGSLYDADGQLIASQTYYNVNTVSYYEDITEVTANVLVYSTDYDRCGLLSMDGRILTTACYSEIEMISKNLFRAQYWYNIDMDQPVYVLLNDKGELVEDSH